MGFSLNPPPQTPSPAAVRSSSPSIPARLGHMSALVHDGWTTRSIEFTVVDDQWPPAACWPSVGCRLAIVAARHRLQEGMSERLPAPTVDRSNAPSLASFVDETWCRHALIDHTPPN